MDLLQCKLTSLWTLRYLQRTNTIKSTPVKYNAIQHNRSIHAIHTFFLDVFLEPISSRIHPVIRKQCLSLHFQNFLLHTCLSLSALANYHDRWNSSEKVKVVAIIMPTGYKVSSKGSEKLTVWQAQNKLRYLKKAMLA